MSSRKHSYSERRVSRERIERLSRKSNSSCITTTGNSTVRSKNSSSLPPLSIAERFMSISSSDIIEKPPTLPKVTDYNITTTTTDTTATTALSLDNGSNIPPFSYLDQNLHLKRNDHDILSLEEKEKGIHPLDKSKKIDTAKATTIKTNSHHEPKCRCSTKTEEKEKTHKAEEEHIIVCESQETLVVTAPSTDSTQNNHNHVKKKSSSPSDMKRREPVAGIWIGTCCFIQTRYHDEDKYKSAGVPLPPPPLPGSSTTRGCCLGRRACVVFTFFTLLILVVLGFILWPRTPLIRIEGASVTVPAKVTQTKQGEKIGNVSFESQWLLNITIDNRCNYLTTRLNRIKIIAKDHFTGLLIGKGLDNFEVNPAPVYLPGHIISTIQLPVSVNYQARDPSDTTFSDLKRACILNNGTRESLSVHFWFTLHIFGLDWTGYKPTIIASPANGGFLCPHNTTVTQ